MASIMTVEKLAARFEDRIEGAKAEVAEFAAKLAVDPANAFEWSTGITEAAARIAVYSDVAVLLRNAAPLGGAPGSDVDFAAETALKVCHRSLMRKARYPEHSTSPMANLMSQNRMVAWAEAIEIIDNAFDRY